MKMKPKLFYIAMYSINLTDAARRAIIIATTTTKASPYQTMTSLHKASQPFCVDLKKENLHKLQCKLCFLYSRIKQPIVFKLKFLNSPSYKNDFDESCKYVRFLVCNGKLKENEFSVLKTAPPCDSKNFSFPFIAKDLLWSAFLVTLNSKCDCNLPTPVYNYNISMFSLHKFLLHKLMYSFVITMYKTNMDQQLKSYSICKLSRSAAYRTNYSYKIFICKQVRTINYFRTFSLNNMSETIDTPMDTSDQDQINDDDMVQQLEQR